MATEDFVRVRIVVAAGHGIAVRTALNNAEVGAEIDHAEMAISCVEPGDKEFKGSGYILEITTHKTIIPKIQNIVSQVVIGSKRGQSLSEPRITATPLAYITDFQRQQICDMFGIEEELDEDVSSRTHLANYSPAELRRLFSGGRASALDVGDRFPRPELVKMVRDAITLFKPELADSDGYAVAELNKKSRPELSLTLFEIIFER